MDNMTAKVSCFARAYHYNNKSIRIFTDDIAEKLLGEDYNQIAKSMSYGIDFFCPGFEGTREEGLRLILDRQLSPSVLGRSVFCPKTDGDNCLSRMSLNPSSLVPSNPGQKKSIP